MARFSTLLVALLAAGAALADAPPQRIVSLNKCTDQLLLALVEPARIASVSPIGSDELSFLAHELKRLPANSGRGESVLLTNADLVLAGPLQAPNPRQPLRPPGLQG